MMLSSIKEPYFPLVPAMALVDGPCPAFYWMVLTMMFNNLGLLNVVWNCNVFNL